MLFCKIIVRESEPEWGGVYNDAKIYNKIFPNSKIFRMNDTNCPKSVINIFIERTEKIKNIINTAKYNLLMVNHEYFSNIMKRELLEYIDILLAKTRVGVHTLLKYKKKYKFKCKIYYTKFTTNTMITNTKKNYNELLHLADKSPFKMTDTVIQTWVNNKKLPNITITCFDDCLKNTKHQLKKQQIYNLQQYIKNSSNIKLHTKFLPNDIITNLKNESGCYICPSYQEGYGHYINEGRSKGAVIITTNAPPMNELINKSNGILVNCKKISHNKCEFLYNYYITEKDLLDAMKKYMNMTEKQKIEMGQKAQSKFIDDTKFFKKKMMDLYLYITKKKKIKFETLANNKINNEQHLPNKHWLKIYIKDTTTSHKYILPTILKINNKIQNYLNKNDISYPTLRIYKSKNYKKTKKGITTILFLNESYLPSILTLGYSYRKYNKTKKYNLICLVQDKKQTFNNITYSGVSKNTINHLLKIYDIVYGIDLKVNVDYKPNINSGFYKNEHYKNISFYLTKSEIFKLVNYEQILFLDASILILKNIDIFFKKNKNNIFRNQVFSYFFSNKILNKSHLIPPGNIYMFKPSIFYYIKSQYLIKNYNTIFKNTKFLNGLDELVIYYTIFDNWSNNNFFISKNWANKYKLTNFDMCEEHDYDSHCTFLMYGILKPFKKNLQKKKFTEWDEITKQLLQKYPKFIKYYKHIKEFRNVDYIK